ncbi:amidohydrolase [Biomphalaria pfeifferi]|uniref:Amidohydrolase n=1 Tax=Biomphalaria pfeifferi TaxID=112525 RepID=A0AAD8AR35_BIOPF|nr:amidohydrolase [Biomphalaria pfeifferi]
MFRKRASFCLKRRLRRQTGFHSVTLWRQLRSTRRKILGMDSRIGSIAVGKDGDIALYDGDPFEYVTHCIGTIIDGKVVSQTVR